MRRRKDNDRQKSLHLIVDDNPEIEEIINVLLSGEGYLVKEADFFRIQII